MRQIWGWAAGGDHDGARDNGRIHFILCFSCIWIVSRMPSAYLKRSYLSLPYIIVNCAMYLYNTRDELFTNFMITLEISSIWNELELRPGKRCPTDAGISLRTDVFDPKS